MSPVVCGQGEGVETGRLVWKPQACPCLCPLVLGLEAVQARRIHSASPQILLEDSGRLGTLG